MTIASLSDGLSFCGVIEEEHALVGTRDSAGLGHPLTAADNAGHRCRVVRVAVRRSGDELVGKIEPSERVHCRDLEGVAHVEVGKQARDSLGEHGLADSRRAVEEHVVPASRGYLASPLRLHLANNIGQVEMAVRVATGSLPRSPQ